MTLEVKLPVLRKVSARALLARFGLLNGLFLSSRHLLQKHSALKRRVRVLGYCLRGFEVKPRDYGQRVDESFTITKTRGRAP